MSLKQVAEELAVTPVAPGGELAEWAMSGEWESDGTEDIAPSFPVIKIVQPTSTMEGNAKHMGAFHRSDTEEFYDHLILVPLFKRDSRALFLAGNDQPLCASSDGIGPRPNQPLWRTVAPDTPELWLNAMKDVPTGEQPGSCAFCPFSQWDGDNPPSCKASVNLLVHHEGSLAQLRISGKSIRPFRQFVARKLAPKKLPLCSQSLDLYTEEHTEPGKKWYELCIDAQPLTPAEARPYNAILRDERARFESSLAIEPDDEPVKDVTPTWEDGSQSFRDRVDLPPHDPETGEIFGRPDDALERSTFPEMFPGEAEPAVPA